MTAQYERRVNAARLAARIDTGGLGNRTAFLLQACQAESQRVERCVLEAHAQRSGSGRLDAFQCIAET